MAAGPLFRGCALCGAALALLLGLLFSGALARAGLFRLIASRVPRLLGLTPAFAPLPWACAHAQLDAISLAGKTALVTGASSGLGLRAAAVLASRGAAVHLACRSAERCAAAAARVRAAAAPGATVSAWALDTASHSSVRAFAAAFLAREGGATAPLDVLLLNAGIASAGAWAAGAPTLPLSVDGIEAVMATNHVGHALLFQLLADRVRAAPSPRVVLTSSASSFDTYSYGVATDLGTLNAPPERGALAVLNPYGQSKLAQVLWAREASRRLAAEGAAHVLVNAVHPGSVDTGIWDANPILSAAAKQTVVAFLRKRVMWSVEDGALTLLWLAMAPEGEVTGGGGGRGGYWHPPCGEVAPHPAALNATLQAAFWDFTEALTRR